MERYSWQVTHEDGTTTSEYDRPDGLGFAEVEKPVKAVSLVADGAVTHCVHVSIGAEPVFFRRRRIVLNAENEQHSTIHCIGWRGVYLFVFEDGHVLLSDDLQAV